MARRIDLLHRLVLLAVAVAKPPVAVALAAIGVDVAGHAFHAATGGLVAAQPLVQSAVPVPPALRNARSEEHTSELQSRENLVCRLLLEKKNKNINKRKMPRNNSLLSRSE